jgi:hypothetical protein
MIRDERTEMTLQDQFILGSIPFYYITCSDMRGEERRGGELQ